MMDEPKVCGVLHPESGFHCGLYRPHPGLPHRVLKEDYPQVKHQSQSEREFAAYRVRGTVREGAR